MDQSADISSSKLEKDILGATFGSIGLLWPPPSHYPTTKIATSSKAVRQCLDDVCARYGKNGSSSHASAAVR